MQGCNNLSIKHICITLINRNNTHLQAYTYLGSENIGQILICPITTIYYVIPFDHVRVCFVHFDYFVIKKTCLSVCGETTIYSAMRDILLKRSFDYMLYGISRVLIG